MTSSSKRIRVHFDSQIGFRTSARGILRSFEELVRALRADASLRVRVRAPWLGRLDRTTRTAHLLDDRILPRMSHDVVHHTYYSPSWLGKYPAKRVVSTVHDMIPELMPELFPNGNPHLAKSAYIDASDLVVCPSLATRDDLLRVHGAGSARVVVIPHGVAPPFLGRGRVPRTTCEAGPIVFIGTRTAYKDFPVAVEAMGLAARTSTAVPRRLLVIGAPPSADERAFVAAAAPEVTIMWVEADDSALANHLHAATALLFPSRYEGFGLPTLEAMACGCPVVLPNVSSHPEVAGDAGWYFRAGEAASCAEALVRLAEDPDERERRQALGLARAESFTWSRSAHLLAQAYRSLLGADG